ncbi:DUF308 domain-containing protein [Odoribacter sp. OttesenSCG-928-L07]|nr:DUF308 domain-containing protein [Odoribacter sp. OttesenSCG-928-L07]MDL2239671.1 DUF308 domain-containing protein [Bacteroidales bacterium OttesenSCG-928-L14]
MARTFFKTVKNSIKNWYLALIAGILFIILGIWVLVTPAASYVTLSVLFSVSFFVIGLIDIIFSISNKDEMDGWGWSLASGILGVILGLILMVYPEISMTTLPFFVGFLIIFRSIYLIGFSIELRQYNIKNWGYLLTLSIIILILGILLVLNPMASALALVVFTGVGFIIIGIHAIYVSIKLKQLKNKVEKVKKNITDNI